MPCKWRIFGIFQGENSDVPRELTADQDESGRQEDAGKDGEPQGRA
jgi:hypothetical protein